MMALEHRGEGERFDIVVVGGGFYGCSLALHLRRSLGGRVLLVEMGPDLLLRASYANQARIHNGYHYPRSLLTALRSHVNVPSFQKDYPNCIFSTFQAYYAIARTFSNVTAQQFQIFCKRIGSPLSIAPASVRRLFNPDRIEAVFCVEEPVFDAVKLRAQVASDLAESGVTVFLDTELVRLERSGSGDITAHLVRAGEPSTVAAGSLYNCTYSRINRLLGASALPLVPLKHEITEMALLRVPPGLDSVGITVMCGPFFSLMPFPPLGLHTLSHVRYTPHCEWHDAPKAPYRDPYQLLERYPKVSRHRAMLADAARYLPDIAKSAYQHSLWEVKTVLPRSEVDDSRPILVKDGFDLSGLTCVMGSKLDNIYDVLSTLRAPV